MNNYRNINTRQPVKRAVLIPLFFILISLLCMPGILAQNTDEKKDDQADKKEQPAGESESTKLDEAADSAIELIKVDGDKEDIWNPPNPRDPFRSLIQKVLKPGSGEERVVTRAGQRPPGIEGMELKEVVLVGLLEVKGKYKAMVIGSDNSAYLLEEGHDLWNAKIKSIDMNCITFEQEVEDLKFFVRRMRQVKRCLESED